MITLVMMEILLMGMVVVLHVKLRLITYVSMEQKLVPVSVAIMVLFRLTSFLEIKILTKMQ